MRNLIAVPVIVFAVILQSAVVSRITLLSGYADLTLVMLAAWALQEDVKSAWHWAVATGILVGFVSRIPCGCPRDQLSHCCRFGKCIAATCLAGSVTCHVQRYFSGNDCFKSFFVGCFAVFWVSLLRLAMHLGWWSYQVYY